MSLDPTLRNKLKNMPRIEPRADREILRRQVLAEVARRERNPRKARKYVLPVAFAGALAVFMFMVMSPWIMQKANDSKMELSRSETGVETMRDDAAATTSPEPSNEASDVPAGHDDGNKEESAEHEGDRGKAEQSESHDPDVPSNEQAPDEGKSDAETEVTQAPTVDYTGQVAQEIEVEGFKEQAPFDRYIFQPYGLQMLIPVMHGGEKWFREPVIDGGAAVFEINRERIRESLLSSITVSVYDDQSPAQVKQDEIATEAETAKELGYKSEHVPEQLANGERIIFTRPSPDQNGGSYLREVFITEQNGLTFVFHIGRSAETSDGWGPRLKDVVYPELKIVK